MEDMNTEQNNNDTINIIKSHCFIYLGLITIYFDIVAWHYRATIMFNKYWDGICL